VNPLRQALHFVMEVTRLDRCVDATALNTRHERWRARSSATLSATASNEWVREIISAKKPAAIGSLGKHECAALAAHLGLRRFYKYTWAPPPYTEADLPRVGVFPANDETYWRFAERLLRDLPAFDGWAQRGHIGERQLLGSRCPQARMLAPQTLEPYFSTAPWTAALRSKRVLVIHSFEPSIRSQYLRRASVWPRCPELLPDFELEIARAPLGFVRSGFNDWFALIDWFQERVRSIQRRWPFDVALIDCGPASLPLTAFVKQIGAVGIHLDGVIPTLFGIHSEALEKSSALQDLAHEGWVHPHASETPELPSGSTPQLFQPKR
jgi:hypothetical protein